MARGRSKDLVALAALLGAASYGTWLWMRSSLELGGGWTDGQQLWTSVRGERIRYAVWDDPEPLPGVEDEVASHPTLSPDGRWLVFVVGERGLNAELYVAEISSGSAQDVRPLWSLNSARDELAPAFAADALYFATDRTGTGDLDIWRAAYAGGTFAPPEPLPRGVNGEADETDPCPLAGGGLLFSSNRARVARRDYELYRAAPTPAGAEAAFAVEPLDALNSPFDERDPTLAADLRTLVFASDRQGGHGGFDLWRSFLEDGSWLAPEPLSGVNDVGSERGPLLSRDGFSLLFDRTGEAGAPELWRARSRELFRVPGPPISWREILVLVSLLLTALFAWLAKRWTALEIIYKCFLVSLLLHLLILWLLRDVYPESGPAQPGAPERAFRVRLAPREESVPQEARERSGELQAQRSEAPDASLERTPSDAPDALARAEPGASERLDAPSQPQPSAPAPSAPALAAPRPERTDVRLESRETPAERQSAPAPALAVAARPAPARPPESAQASVQPLAAERAAGAAAPAQTVAAARPRASAEREALEAPAAAAAPEAQRLAPSDVPSPERPSQAVALPRESLAAPPAAPAPALALPEAQSRAGEAERRAPQGAREPDRLAQDALAAGSPAAAAAPARGSPEVALRAPDPQAPAREKSGVAAPSAATPDVSLESREAAEPRQAGQAPELAVAARAAPARPEGEARDAVPERLADAAAGAATALAAPVRPRADDARESLGAPQASPDAPGGERLAPDDLAHAGAPAQDVAQPREAPPEPAPGALVAPSLALPGARSRAGEAAARETVAGAPGRLDADASGSGAGPRVAPEAPVALAVPRQGELGAPRRAELSPEPARPGGVPPIELRAPQAASPSTRASAPDEGPRRFDALAGLERAAPGRLEVAAAASPAPPRSDDRPAPPQPEVRAPEPLALALPKPPVAAPKDERPKLTREDTYKNRFGGEKLRALEEFGGGQETERAVAAGLRYLASIQNERGFWGSRRDYKDKYGDVRIGKTALALLAFLGAGHTPRSGAEHARVAERAVSFLLSQLDPKSGHFGDCASYGHGIATYALAECFALTRDPVLQEPLRTAVAHILANQSSREDPRYQGGWGYYYNDGRSWENDRWPRVSVTSWQVMALESARLGGLEVPESAFDGARAFLLEAWDERREAFRYNHDPARLRSSYPILPASTPAAMFALSLLGRDLADPELAPARRFVLERLPQEFRFTSESAFVYEGQGNEYFWYYATLAMFRAGGGSWRRWNEAMKQTLLPAQASDGSWPGGSTYAEFAGDDEADRSYRTAMCVLTLEVYYRYFTPLLAER